MPVLYSFEDPVFHFTCTTTVPVSIDILATVMGYLSVILMFKKAHLYPKSLCFIFLELDDLAERRMSKVLYLCSATALQTPWRKVVNPQLFK